MAAHVEYLLQHELKLVLRKGLGREAVVNAEGIAKVLKSRLVEEVVPNDLETVWAF
jgi:hypothetical protein